MFCQNWKEGKGDQTSEGRGQILREAQKHTKGNSAARIETKHELTRSQTNDRIIAEGLRQSLQYWSEDLVAHHQTARDST